MDDWIGPFRFFSNFDSGNLASASRSSSSHSSPPPSSSMNNSDGPSQLQPTPPPPRALSSSGNGGDTFYLQVSPDCHGTAHENANRSWFYFGVSYSQIVAIEEEQDRRRDAAARRAAGKAGGGNNGGAGGSSSNGMYDQQGRRVSLTGGAPRRAPTGGNSSNNNSPSSSSGGGAEGWCSPPPPSTSAASSSALERPNRKVTLVVTNFAATNRIFDHDNRPVFCVSPSSASAAPAPGSTAAFLAWDRLPQAVKIELVDKDGNVSSLPQAALSPLAPPIPTVGGVFTSLSSSGNSRAGGATVDSSSFLSALTGGSSGSGSTGGSGSMNANSPHVARKLSKAMATSTMRISWTYTFTKKEETVFFAMNYPYSYQTLHRDVIPIWSKLARESTSDAYLMKWHASSHQNSSSSAATTTNNGTTTAGAEVAESSGLGGKTPRGLRSANAISSSSRSTKIARPQQPTRTNEPPGSPSSSSVTSGGSSTTPVVSPPEESVPLPAGKFSSPGQEESSTKVQEKSNNNKGRITLFNPYNEKSAYLHQETLCYSAQNRCVELLTISGYNGLDTSVPCNPDDPADEDYLDAKVVEYIKTCRDVGVTEGSDTNKIQMPAETRKRLCDQFDALLSRDDVFTREAQYAETVPVRLPGRCRPCTFNNLSPPALSPSSPTAGGPHGSGGGKREVLVTARVHPGEVPASHVMHGFIHFLLSADARAVLLRKNFIFRCVPMLNPDGVVLGHYRTDSFGVNLNRMYGNPDMGKHPTIYATRRLFLGLANGTAGGGGGVPDATSPTTQATQVSPPPQQQQCKLALYVDLHAHASKRGCFVFGNALDDRASQVSNLLYPKLLDLNCPFFDFTSCDFTSRSMAVKNQTDGMTKEGTGRVALAGLTNGLLHSYTLEVSYNTGIASGGVGASRAPGVGSTGSSTSSASAGGPSSTSISSLQLDIPNDAAKHGATGSIERRAAATTAAAANGGHGLISSSTNGGGAGGGAAARYSPVTYYDVGRGIAVSLLDLFQLNPSYSRIPHTSFTSVNGVKAWIDRSIRQLHTEQEKEDGVEGHYGSSVAGGGSGGGMGGNGGYGVSTTAGGGSFSSSTRVKAQARRQNMDRVASTLALPALNNYRQEQRRTEKREAAAEKKLLDDALARDGGFKLNV